MNYKGLTFDDFVEEELNGVANKWSQVCKSCTEKYFKDEVHDEIPIDGVICGVENCKNEAIFYLDFGNEK